MNEQNVMVGYLHGPTITAEFHHCLLRLELYDGSTNRRVRRYAGVFSGVNVCKHRNQLVTDFLADERCEWLWMLDQDATFPPTMLDSLLASADPLERPIIGALAHQRRIQDDRQVVLPTMYQTEWDGPRWVGYREVVKYRLGLEPVDATGCHCLLVHRSVFEAIKSSHPYRWFREDLIAEDTICGEDIWFCVEARKAGFPIFVDTRLESGHVKPVILTHEQSHVERVA